MCLHTLLKFALVGALAITSRVGFAEPEERHDLFESGVKAFESGKPADAIADFEALADRGVVRPELSFDRGLAYVERVRAGGGLPGDLGRAAHGFEETRQMAHDPELRHDAEAALKLIRTEIARRQARSGAATELDEGMLLDREAIGMFSENTWAAAAAAMSLLLTMALVVRGRSKDTHTKLAATVTMGAAFVLGLLSVGAVFRARDVRLHEKLGVIVTESARVTDDHHVVIPGAKSIPEAARVVIDESQGGWAHVRWGAVAGWLPITTVRTLSVR